MGAGGVHGGHGVGGARRVGVGVPAGRQRDRPRHAGQVDWPLHRGVNLTSGILPSDSMQVLCSSFFASKLMNMGIHFFITLSALYPEIHAGYVLIGSEICVCQIYSST